MSRSRTPSSWPKWGSLARSHAGVLFSCHLARVEGKLRRQSSYRRSPPEQQPSVKQGPHSHTDFFRQIEHVAWFVWTYFPFAVLIILSSENIRTHSSIFQSGYSVYWNIQTYFLILVRVPSTQRAFSGWNRRWIPRIFFCLFFFWKPEFSFKLFIYFKNCAGDLRYAYFSVVVTLLGTARDVKLQVITTKSGW